MKHARDEASTSRTANKRTRNQHAPAPLPLPLLPDEILTEVFARLPAKSVGRFRCMSRCWNTTLSSRSFADLHLERANKHQSGPPRLFFTVAQYHFYSWHHGGAVEQLTGVLPLPRLAPDCAVQVLTKPCHGLVLLRRWPYHGHYVCNPSTGALVLLPDSGIPHNLMAHRGGTVSYGLGYVSTTKEHKVVRLFYRTRRDVSFTTCEVLSLNASTHWRPANGRPPSCTLGEESTAAVFFNGYLHFVQQEGRCTIITFDVRDEVFSSLLPPLGLENALFQVELTVLDGCLCLHYGEDPLKDVPYLIWRLKSYDGGGQWEQLCCIQRQAWPEALLRSNCLSPLEIYSGDNGHKKIMFATAASTVFIVDIEGGGGREPEILLSAPPPPVKMDKAIMDSFIKHKPPYTVGLLEESLVCVGRTHEEIIFSSPSTKAWSDILKWLPTRSIVAFTCMCRDWRAIIESNRFMRLHNLHANLGKSPRVMLLGAFSGGGLYSLEGFGRELPQLHAYLFDGTRSRAVCSKPCHGLVGGSCINMMGHSLDFICNPATEYYKYLDTYVGEEDDSFLAGRFGLGYDSKTNKHVHVRFAYMERNLSTRDYQLQCYIQFTGAEIWSAVNTPPRPVADMQPAYADGKLYWMVDPNLGKVPSRCEILALDVGTKEFEVLQGPSKCNRDQITSIVELQGRICILCSDKTMNAIDIWSAEDNFWSVGCRIELGDNSPEFSSDEATLLDVDPKDGRLLISTGKALGYYDHRTGTLETIHYLEEGEHGMRFLPVLCHESLICDNIRHVGRVKFSLSS
ncbi:hypothetical protein ZWY2020_024046 [Hordeum vulgare]|nr:hypothetical protein ZWY2020_024046 [Hordeum vulgare]